MKELLLVLVLLFTSIAVQADNKDGERLIKGCNELMGMYKNKNEKRLMTSLTVSSSDAMLAGYCMGVVKMAVSQHKNRCYTRDWYQLAEYIASNWRMNDQKLSMHSAVREVCSGF